MKNKKIISVLAINSLLVSPLSLIAVSCGSSSNSEVQINGKNLDVNSWNVSKQLASKVTGKNEVAKIMSSIAPKLATISSSNTFPVMIRHASVSPLGQYGSTNEVSKMKSDYLKALADSLYCMPYSAIPESLKYSNQGLTTSMGDSRDVNNEDDFANMIGSFVTSPDHALWGSEPLREILKFNLAQSFYNFKDKQFQYVDEIISTLGKKVTNSRKAEIKKLYESIDKLQSEDYDEFEYEFIDAFTNKKGIESEVDSKPTIQMRISKKPIVQSNEFEYNLKFDIFTTSAMSSGLNLPGKEAFSVATKALGSIRIYGSQYLEYNQAEYYASKFSSNNIENITWLPSDWQRGTTSYLRVSPNSVESVLIGQKGNSKALVDLGSDVNSLDKTTKEVIDSSFGFKFFGAKNLDQPNPEYFLSTSNHYKNVDEINAENAEWSKNQGSPAQLENNFANYKIYGVDPLYASSGRGFWKQYENNTNSNNYLDQIKTAFDTNIENEKIWNGTSSIALTDTQVNSFFSSFLNAQNLSGNINGTLLSTYWNNAFGSKLDTFKLRDHYVGTQVINSNNLSSFLA